MENTYTTERGVTVKFKGIAALLDKLNASHKMPEVPCYTIKSTLTGGTETFPHNETTLKTDEDRKVWAEYKAQLNQAESKKNTALVHLILLRGIEVEQPANEDWVREQEYLGIMVPTEPFERKVHWLETEVFSGISDIEHIIEGVMRASGVDEETLAAMAESFRGPLGQPAGNADQSTGVPANQPDLVLQPEVRAGDDGLGNGKVSKRVRRSER